MQKSFVRMLGAVAAVVAMSTGSMAASSVAQLLSSTGKVMVQQGEGFVPVLEPVALKAGDQIMVGAESGAELLFVETGCTVTVAESSVFRVGEFAPCAKGEQMAFAEAAFVQPVATDDDDDDDLLPFLLLGGAAAAVLVVVVVAKDENDPASVAAPPPPPPPPA